MGTASDVKQAKAAAKTSAAPKPTAPRSGLAAVAQSALGQEAVQAYQRILKAMPKVSAAQVKVVPTAQQARVITRAEWQTERDKGGGRAGMVRGVDIGSLLSAWHKAMASAPSFTVASRSANKATYALILGLNAYKKNRTVAETIAVRETVERILKAVDAHAVRAGIADNAAKKLDVVLKNLRETATSAPVKFAKLQTLVKEVNTALRRLSDIETSVIPIANWWGRQVDTRVSQGGVKASPEDTADYQRASAAGLANLVDAVRTELVKNRIIEDS